MRVCMCVCDCFPKPTIGRQKREHCDEAEVLCQGETGSGLESRPCPNKKTASMCLPKQLLITRAKVVTSEQGGQEIPPAPGNHYKWNLLAL